MADLISRAAVLERMISTAGCGTCDNYNYVRCRACSWDDAINIVEEMSEVDAALMVHGKWKWSHGGECSECGFHNSNFDYRYCPMCGAKMDEKRRDEDGSAN